MKTIEVDDGFGGKMEIVASYSLRERLDELEELKYTGCFAVAMSSGKVTTLEFYIESPYQPTRREVRERRVHNFLTWIGEGLGVDFD